MAELIERKEVLDIIHLHSCDTARIEEGVLNLPIAYNVEKVLEKESGKSKSKKTPTVYYPTDDLLNQAFTDYVKMRKELKKPMTERAVQLAMNKLETLSGGDNDTAIKIIEQSIERSWAGLFELKEDKKDGKKSGGIDWSKV